MVTERQQHFIDRLTANRDAADAEVVRITTRHAALTERGVDTSKPVPFQSPDQSLAKAEALAATAQKNLDQYLDQIAQKEA